MAVQAKARSSGLYEQDLHAWSEVQTDLLRRRRFSELDLQHVVEEIEDVGGSLYREVRSHIRTIIEHLLKLEHSAATEPRAGWERTIRIQRVDLAEDLTPSLRPRIERGLARFYAAARIEAAAALRAHGEPAAADALPTTSPYTLDQITGTWLPDRADRRIEFPDPSEPAKTVGDERHDQPTSSERPVGVEVDFPAALELADIAISCDDLRRAALFLERLMKLHSSETNFWADEVLAEAIWAASIIRYARAFDQRGAKSKKLNPGIYRGWDGAASMHAKFIKMRNKHVAHDRSPKNQCKIGIDGHSEPTLRVCQLQLYALPDMGDVQNLYKLVRGALERALELERKQTEKVLGQAKRLGMEYLRSRPVLTVRAPRGHQVLDENRVGWPREKILK